MQLLEIYFRFAGVTLLIMQLVFIVRDAWDVRPARFGALLILGLIDIVVADAPTDEFIPLWLQFPLDAMAMNTAVFIWWFALSLFDDDFRLRRLEWAVAILWFALGVPNFTDFVLKEPLSYPWAAYARSVMAVGIVAHIVYRAFAGRRTDLVEGRRRARIFLAFSIAALFLIALWSEFVFGFHSEPLWFSTIEHGLFLAVIVWSSLWLLRMEKSVMMFDKPVAPAPASEPQLTPKESLIHEKLLAAVEGERAYLEPELSIGALAERIGAPEHQVRALINKAMGFRNFRSFLNRYRLDAARHALSEPQKAAIPILTIAMDSGFASLSSFNRAFRDSTGVTPSAFRQAALENTPPQN